MLIYYIQNKTNDKLYIGLTTRTFEERIYEHKNKLENNSHYNQYLQNSWNKYGEDDFVFSILEDGFDDIEELIDAENYWIGFLNSKEKRHGYNCNFSAEHDYSCYGKYSKSVYQYEYPSGKLLNKFDSLKDASEFVSGTTRCISKCCRGNSITMYGYYWSYEEFDVYPYTKGKYTPVYQFSLDGKFLKEWDNITEAQDELGISRANIKRCCQGIHKQSGGFIWRHKFSKDGETNKKELNLDEPVFVKGKKPVYQYDLNGEFIKEWESAGAVQNELGFHRNSISSCCRGNKYNKTAYGFMWKYKHEVDNKNDIQPIGYDEKFYNY